ncbi:MAG: peptidoglycan editing factor PgeF, partial [Balneolaceae bacterium]
KDLGLTQNEIVFGNQIHNSDILVAEKAGIYADTDAFVTKTSGLALAIQVADCAAVLLGDEENGVIGAAHAGWRGAVDDIVPKVISRMKEAGAETNFIKVFISPSISQVNFEVGEEVAAQFPKQFVDFESQSKPHVNLKAFLKYQLLNSGILSVNIEIDEGCTISDENFYSYRRQKDKSGRMMGIIKLEEI